MTISVGQRLPEATLLEKVDGKIGPVDLGARLKGRKVALFGLPGAFTPTCSSAHVPSFIRNAGALAEKGVDEIICVSVNDPHVMRAWAEATGGDKAGIAFLADADGSFTRAIGLDFTAPDAGLIGRSRRYTMLVEDGVVSILNIEEARGVCELSAAETLLDQM